MRDREALVKLVFEMVTEGVGEAHLINCKRAALVRKRSNRPKHFLSLTPTSRASSLKTSTAIMMYDNGFNNSKSLSEQINDVINMKGSRAEKVKALIKLGIRENEISFVLPVVHREGKPRFSFTFGVEIECNMPRYRFEDVASRDNVPYEFEGYNHNDNRDHFKFVSDSSIRPSSGRVGEPIECVSPILNGNKSGFDKLEACCNALNEAGAYVNTSTGLHVHIGASELSDEQYVNVFKNYQKLQKVISSFLAPSRRDAYYCKPIDGYDFSYCHTPSAVRSVMGYNRYHSVNAESFVRHHTIEFRQHQGSTNFTKIKMWVTFLSKLVAYSMNNVIENEVETISEIPFLTAAEKRFFETRKQEVNRGRVAA